MLRPSHFPGLLTDGRDHFSENLTPGKDVYGEKLVVHEGKEYRFWDPKRSKMAAYLVRGGGVFPFEKASRVLYLGAASGTTASHVSDLCPRGQVLCVEFSKRAFRDLTILCESRKNMLPILADASLPESYKALARNADVLYQDISQRDQAGIFLKNLPLLRPGGVGFLMVKARSIDVNAAPQAVFSRSRKELEAGGFRVAEAIELGPLEKDHAALVGTKP